MCRMGKRFTRQDVLQQLRAAIAEAGSQAAFAERAGVSSAFVGDVLRDRRRPTGPLLAALRLTEQTVYIPTEKSA